MNEDIDYNKLKNLHTVGIKGIFDVVFRHNTFKKAPFLISIGIGLLFSTIIGFCAINKIFKILTISTELILTVFPSLLGFSLGGYAIVVGFSNIDLIKSSTEKTKHSIYQKLNGIFALSIIVQALVTIIGVVIAWSIKVDIASILEFSPSNFFINTVNILVLFILFVTSIYSLVLIPFVVTNMFTLSQLNNLHYTLGKLKEQNIENKSSAE